jgi:signal transduction histidine kinase
VIRSIRWRIGLSVFLVIATLQLVLAVYLLDRRESAALAAIDGALSGRIRALRLRSSVEDLSSYIRAEDEERNGADDEIFIEVRLGSGPPLVSPNLPPEGLGPCLTDAGDFREFEGSPYRLYFWDRPNPRDPGRTIRAAELELGKYEWRVAQSLDRMYAEYSSFRANLMRGILAVSLLGACGAWWVARRALVPVHAMTVRARELGGRADGSLPRTGTGDELDRLGEVLNVLIDGLRSQVMHVRRVSAEAAHAVRTPLAAIRASLELHIQRVGEKESTPLLGILGTLDETIGTIHRLLFLESVEANPLDPESAETLKLDVLVHELVEALDPIAEEHSIRLVSSLDAAEIRGDPPQLRSAILNLLENAIQHTPQGGEIEVTLDAGAGQACVAVQDSGPGLRPDQLERVFERFYSERRGGTGIGLSIARAIAHAHGGSLTASSPAGARFELRLPLCSA